MTHIEKYIWKNAMSYTAYRTLIDSLRAQGKTTGENHSEAMLAYADLNISRMKRLEKRTRLAEETIAFLGIIQKPIYILTITEGWCGDAAQITPVIEKIAQLNPNIQQRFILRDENLEIMDAFLTNGGRSIPKFLFLDPATLEVKNTWGPRPAEVQTIMKEAKIKIAETEDVAAKKIINGEVKHAIHLWYAKDKTRKIQAEFIEQLQKTVLSA